MEVNKFYISEAVVFMKNCLPDSYIDLTVTSPPYDNLRTYNGFSFNSDCLIEELYRCTKKGGVVVWIVNDGARNGDESGNSFRQALKFKQVGFKLFDTMIYFKNCGLNSGSNRSYIQKFEYMFVFTKGKIKTVHIIEDRPNVDLRSRKGMKKRNVEEGGYRMQDILVKDHGKRYNVWAYNTGIPHSTPDKIAYKHPAIFPERLAEDHIISWSNEGDLIFDPMCGSGTVCKMAWLNKRNFIGVDSNEDYINNICIPRLVKYGWSNNQKGT